MERNLENYLVTSLVQLPAVQSCVSKVFYLKTVQDKTLYLKFWVNIFEGRILYPVSDF